MRVISALLVTATLASCTAGPPGPPPPPSPKALAEFQSLTAGRLPQREINCLPNYNANDMTVIDGRTLGFRRGMNTVYVMHLTPGCEMATSGGYAFVSRQYGGMGLCRGDIQQVVDTANHINVGSCTIAAIIPYTRRP